MYSSRATSRKTNPIPRPHSGPPKPPTRPPHPQPSKEALYGRYFGTNSLQSCLLLQLNLKLLLLLLRPAILSTPSPCRPPHCQDNPVRRLVVAFGGFIFHSFYFNVPPISSPAPPRESARVVVMVPASPTNLHPLPRRGGFSLNFSVLLLFYALQFSAHFISFRMPHDRTTPFRFHVWWACGRRACVCIYMCSRARAY